MKIIFIIIITLILSGCTSQSSSLIRDDDPKTDFADNGVYRAWSIFRVIATSLLVIAMLTMVIATAVRS